MTAKATQTPLKMLSDAFRQYLPYANLGYQLVIAVGGGFLLGWWIDGKTGTEPLFMIVGALFGMGAGIFLVVRTVSEMNHWNKK